MKYPRLPMLLTDSTGEIFARAELTEVQVKRLIKYFAVFGIFLTARPN